MTEFFKNNPIALRHCFLYEHLRSNSAVSSFFSFVSSFEVFGDTVGHDVIKRDEYDVWFNKFKQEILDMNKLNTDMRDDLRSDKYALRACILYESIKYKLAERGSPTHRLWPYSNMLINDIENSPSFFTYKMFCDVVGDDVMEYREFDFWFYRFFNGKYDWNFEIDKDKTIHELMDMPNNVMKSIVEYLDIFDRINLSRTSRSLQTFGDDQELFHHTLRLEITNYLATISFRGPFKIEYIWDSVDCKRTFKRRETHFRSVDHWKQALLDFKGIVKNPKLHLDTLKIGLDDLDTFFIESDVGHENLLNDLKDELKFTHYLNVKNLILEGCSWETVATILPILKPEYLTTINFNYFNSNPVPMNTVFDMEQWKQAKCFSMAGYYFNWPLHHLYHFKEFQIRLNELSVEDIHQMRETLFNSPNFEKCSISVNNVADKIEEVFRYSAWQEPNTPGDMKIYHYPIQNSSDYFEIETRRWDIKITKKKV